MYTEKFIDYLQYSIPFKNTSIPKDAKQIYPMKNYKNGFQDAFGIRIYTGNVRSDKPLYVLSAQALREVEKYVSIREHMESEIKKGAKFSRVDWAMDCFIGDDLIDIEDYMNWHKDGKIIMKDTWKETCKVIASVTDKGEQNETLYFGNHKKRGKHGIVRVYDKGIDLGEVANAMIRLEIEEKRDNAHTSAKRFIDGATVGEIIRTRFDVKDERFQSAINAQALDISRGEEEESEEEETQDSKWLWLVSQVAPVLGKQIALDAIDGSRANFDIFQATVDMFYNKEIRKHNVEEMNK